MCRFAVLAVCVILGFSQAGSADAAGTAGADWLYMVKTRPSQPSREAEFNAWYDDIDIPDVLAVKGFERARRAVGLDMPADSGARLKPDDGKYVALYEIDTANMDKTIVDMYVASRKMTALNRSTDALKVVEANYYRRLEQTQFEAGAASKKYIYIQKILCCRTQSQLSDYRLWFARQHAAAMRANGLTRVSLYELYRVMEEVSVGADEIPHLLAIYEIDADSEGAAWSKLQRAFGVFDLSGPATNRYEVRDSILYSQMSDRASK